MSAEHDDYLLPEGLDALPAGALRLPAARDDLRQALKRQTTRIIAGRARRSRLVRAGQLALAYAAGVMTLWALSRPPVEPDGRPQGVPRQEIVQAQAKPEGNGSARGTIASDRRGIAADAGSREAAESSTSDIASSLREDGAQEPYQGLTPWELRARVGDASLEEKIRLLRVAGDRYLNDYRDIAAALHCYRQILELAPPSREQPIDAEDSWLLAELKHAYVLDARLRGHEHL